MKFLVDNQLPPALALWLTQQGVAASHVSEVGLATGSDREIWELALQTDAIVISKDEDFIHLAHRPGDAGRLLWVRLGNCRRQMLINRFTQLWPAIIQAFAEGQRIVELR